MADNPFRNDEDQSFGKLEDYVVNATSSPQTPAQPTQYAQPATLQPSVTPNQPAAQPQVAPRPVPQPTQPVVQQFGQPQQPQPAQRRQTTTTPTTASTRYNQTIQQNAPQAQAVSSGLAQAIQNPVDQARQKLAAAQKEFNDKVAASGLTRNQDATSALINKAANLKTGQTLTPEEFAQLQSITDTKSKFGEGVRDTDFIALQNYVDAMGQAQKAQEYAGLTGDDASRQQLLNTLVNNAQYGQGQSLLDSLLAGGVQPAAQQLGDIRKNLITEDQLGKALTNAQTGAAGTRAAEQDEINAAYQDIQNMLDNKEQGTGVLSDLEQGIKNRVAAKNKDVKATNDLIDKALINSGPNFGDSKLEKQLIAKLKLSPADVKLIQQAGPDLRSTIVNKLKDVNEQTVTTGDELARLNQLYKIGGLVNRQGDHIAAQEGEDLGSLYNQKAKIDSAQAKKAANENKAAADQRASELKKDAIETLNVPGYMGNKNPSNAKTSALDAYDRMFGGRVVPGDTVDADRVIKTFQSQIDAINKNYTDKGLPAPVSVKPSQKQIMEQANKVLAHSHGWTIPGLMQYPPKGYSGPTIDPIKKYKTAEEFQKADPKNFKLVQDHAIRMATLANIANQFGFNKDLRK